MRRFTLTLTTEYTGMTETDIALWVTRMRAHGWPSIKLEKFINGAELLFETRTDNTTVQSRATVLPVSQSKES